MSDEGGGRTRTDLESSVSFSVFFSLLECLRYAVAARSIRDWPEELFRRLLDAFVLILLLGALGGREARGRFSFEEEKNVHIAL